ncbi:UTRA domain-containing protein [Bradyrhizobium sp. Leo121]|uniref:UTRA domain-containing protein n=1 Tax=Bradyrhizobium sp. Leo121 TaxID=1571195 RepID=UPI0032E4B416
MGTADLEASKLLEVPLGSPVAEVRRVFNTASDRVIYLGEVTYRGDFIRIDRDRSSKRKAKRRVGRLRR